MANNEHAARLRELAQQEVDMAKTFSPMYSSGLIATCRADAAALLAGAEALEKVDHMRRFFEALSADGSPVLMGFAYQVDRILDAEDTAALARLEGK